MSEHFCTYKDCMCELDVDEAYTEGYQQGKADQKKEDNEFFNFDKVIEIEKSKSYQQGAREFAEWCIQNNIDFSHCEDSDCDNCTRTICRNAQTYTDVVLAEWQKGEQQ